MPLLVAIIVVVIGILIAFVIVREEIRNRDRDLDGIDRNILKEIRRNGGKILQSQLMERLNMSKATLWRRIKRLEEKGYIEIKKIGNVNVLLIRRD